MKNYKNLKSLLQWWWSAVAFHSNVISSGSSCKRMSGHFVPFCWLCIRAMSYLVPPAAWRPALFSVGPLWEVDPPALNWGLHTQTHTYSFIHIRRLYHHCNIIVNASVYHECLCLVRSSMLSTPSSWNSSSHFAHSASFLWQPHWEV